MTSRVTQLDRDIAGRVGALRKDRKLTQTLVAEALGLSYQSYQKIEGGRVTFRASTLQKLSTLFGVPVQTLFGEGDTGDIPNAAELAHITAIVMRTSKDEVASILHCAIQAGHRDGRTTKHT